MNSVHPAFAMALNTICPPTTPPCPDGSYEYVYESDIGELVCWFDHQPREAQTEWEPGCDEDLSLTHVWLVDIDISERLAKRFKQQLETEALEYLQSNRSNDD